MKKLLILSLFISMLLFGCSNGGDGASPPPEPEPPVTLTIEDLAGYYELEGFYLWDNEGWSMDQDDVTYFYGEMGIFLDYFVYQDIDINGYWIYAEGSILEIENDRIEVYSFGQTYWVDIEFDKDKGTLITTLEPGVVSDIGEKDYWRKVDTISQNLATQGTLKEDADLQGKSIGGAVKELWDWLP